MEKNYNKEMTLEKSSNRLKLLPRFFQRFFKAYLGDFSVQASFVSEIASRGENTSGYRIKHNGNS
jgi:hypothetical protein